MQAFRSTSHRVEPNVTPMVDVMLVLLIIFMVVAPGLMTGLLLTLPTAENLREHPDDPGDQTLGIDAEGHYYLNKRPIPRGELANALTAIYAARPNDRVLCVRADKKLSYSVVLDALDVARQNGALVAGMISEKPSQSNARRRTR
jgi:biopolymer transport protein ExbD